jgi:DNA-directed RNA polymerase specialized sigma24 family protein
MKLSGRQGVGSEEGPFDRLLAFLDSSGDTTALTEEQIREQQGRFYEEIRRRQIRIFAWRGSPEPELLADRTFDRVMEKVPEIEGTFDGDPSHYVASVGRLIFLESLRKPKRTVPPPSPEKTDERALDCLDRCLEKILPAEERELILDYYRGEKHKKIDYRQHLAERLGTTLNSLRIRSYRIRKKLGSCVADCMKRNESAEIGIVE